MHTRIDDEHHLSFWNWNPCLSFLVSWQIIDNKCGYTVEGDVYFSVDNFPDYCCLSRRKLDDNRAGERVTVDVRKKNPADFALWKVRITLFVYHNLHTLRNHPVLN